MGQQHRNATTVAKEAVQHSKAASVTTAGKIVQQMQRAAGIKPQNGIALHTVDAALRDRHLVIGTPLRRHIDRGVRVVEGVGGRRHRRRRRALARARA